MVVQSAAGKGVPYDSRLVGGNLIRRQRAGDAAVFQDMAFVTALVKGELIERRGAAR